MRAGRTMLLAVLAWTTSAVAESPPSWSPGEPRPGALAVEVEGPSRSSGDGVYGRFNGDVSLVPALGVELGGDQPRGAGRLDLRYYSTAGVYASYRDALGQQGAPPRMLSCGVSLRPLFIPRWSKDLERGPAVLDLTLDSLSVGIGRYWGEPVRGPFGRDRGFEAALGLAVPLLGKANGLWLEAYGELRWSDAPGARGEPPVATALALVSWQLFANTPLVKQTDPD